MEWALRPQVCSRSFVRSVRQPTVESVKRKFWRRSGRERRLTVLTASVVELWEPLRDDLAAGTIIGARCLHGDTDPSSSQSSITRRRKRSCASSGIASPRSGPKSHPSCHRSPRNGRRAESGAGCCPCATDHELHRGGRPGRSDRGAAAWFARFGGLIARRLRTGATLFWRHAAASGDKLLRRLSSSRAACPFTGRQALASRQQQRPDRPRSATHKPATRSVLWINATRPCVVP